MTTTASALAPATEAPAGLTSEEANYVYNIEVLGLPARKAAALAGMALTKQCMPHIQQARTQLRKQVRGDMAITKEDIVYGMMDAVGRAKLLGEPMTEIVGLEKVSRLLGFDQPQKIDINIRTTIEVLRQQARSMSLEELMSAVPGAGEVLDAQFYEIKSDVSP